MIAFDNKLLLPQLYIIDKQAIVSERENINDRGRPRHWPDLNQVPYTTGKEINPGAREHSLWRYHLFSSSCSDNPGHQWRIDLPAGNHA